MKIGDFEDVNTDFVFTEISEEERNDAGFMNDLADELDTATTRDYFALAEGISSKNIAVKIRLESPPPNDFLVALSKATDRTLNRKLSIVVYKCLYSLWHRVEQLILIVRLRVLITFLRLVS